MAQNYKSFWSTESQFICIFFGQKLLFQVNLSPFLEILKTRAAKATVLTVNPFIAVPPTSLQNNSWIGNHPANQTSPCVCFWWDAGAGNRIRSLPDLISVIDWNNRRSETMKQPHYVCPCHITSLWMVPTREEPLFICEVCPRLPCQGRLAHHQSMCVLSLSIKVWLIQAFEWW